MSQELLFSLIEAHVTYGGTPLFEALDLTINAGDKACLIGKNGAGKSSLMKLITGDRELDGGKRWIKPGISVGYLEQDVHVNLKETVLEFVLSALPDNERTDEKHYLVDIMLDPFDLDKTRPMSELSGGQIRRASLARTLIVEPDILLLDEPTNHMDVHAIGWLESYLARYQGALICISHDRAFLRNISQRILWLDRGIIRTCPKGYEHFEEWSTELMEQEFRELVNREKKEALESEWASKGVKARRKRNIRRLNQLHDMRQKLREDKRAFLSTKKTIDLDPISPTLASKIVAEFHHVSKSFHHNGEEHPILDRFSMRILRGEKIGIVGRNGSGKSTFLKLMLGELEADMGRVKLGKHLEFSYFDQHREDIDPKKTLWETLCPNGGDHVIIGGDHGRSRHVCAYLKDFMFDPKMARHPVGTLSGGQRNRLLLAKILINPGSVLILDEPTNDLDMETLDMLQELLSDFEGTLFLVSHDRDFIDRIATKTLIFEGDGVIEGYVGGYSDAMAQRNPPKKKATNAPSGSASTSDEAPKTAKSRTTKTLSYKLQRELEQLPGQIDALTARVESYQKQLADPTLYTTNPQEFDRISFALVEAENTLETAELRWLELEDMRENL